MKTEPIRLHYEECGEGSPLILLHGNGENHSYFRHQIAYFSKKYRVLALDTRGHGESPRGEAPFTIAQFAEDLRDFLEDKGIERAHILGFSDGGNIALCFALKYPERIDKLILNGANLLPAGVERSVQMSIEIGYRTASLAAKFDPKARAHAEMLGLMVKEPNIVPGELARLSMPVLVIAGTRDMIREDHTRLIHESLPNSELVFLEGDHFIANQQPEAFNAAVEAFLERKKGEEKSI